MPKIYIIKDKEYIKTTIFLARDLYAELHRLQGLGQIISRTNAIERALRKWLKERR